MVLSSLLDSHSGRSGSDAVVYCVSTCCLVVLSMGSFPPKSVAGLLRNTQDVLGSVVNSILCIVFQYSVVGTQSPTSVKATSPAVAR